VKRVDELIGKRNCLLLVDELVAFARRLNCQYELGALQDAVDTSAFLAAPHGFVEYLGDKIDGDLELAVLFSLLSANRFQLVESELE
jgi:hypothetical protein